jgi:hypothetical protein
MFSDVIDICQIAIALPVAELWRRSAGPATSAKRARAWGRWRVARNPDEGARLRRLIRVIDTRLPDSGNCYRRALAEMALDPDSAAESLHFGVIRSGGPKSGHAWLASDEPQSSHYDAEFII